MRWQNPVSINQSEEGDFNYARVRTIYAVTEMSLAQFLIEKVAVKTQSIQFIGILDFLKDHDHVHLREMRQAVTSYEDPCRFFTDLQL